MMPAVSRAVRRNEGWRNQPRVPSGEHGGEWAAEGAVSYEDNRTDWEQSIEQGEELTPEEEAELYNYVNDFTINEKLREAKGDLSYEIGPDGRSPAGSGWIDEVGLLDAAIEKGVTTRPIVVYRGMSANGLGDYSWQRPEDLVGLIFANDGYMSTSGREGAARGFTSGEGPVMIEITVPAGTNGLLVDKALTKRPMFPSEAEFLLGRGHYLEFTSATDDEWGDITATANLRTDLR